MERVREWAGPGCVAVLLAGSHAAGDAVWAECGGKLVTLSDLDVYAVIATPGGRQAARTRALLARPGLSAWLLDRGFAAPLEVAFLTPPEVAKLAPRPGTLDLRRHARVVVGDPAWRERVPAWRAADVPDEEVDLLLENRGMELLLAHPGSDSEILLDRLRARHAVLKVALDLAAVAALDAGEYPDGAAARVRWARANSGARASPPALPTPFEREANDAGLERLWDAALAWRSGSPVDPGRERALRDWNAAAAAWCAAWWSRSGRGPAGAEPDPYARACRFAARARLRRRAREAVLFRARSGAVAPLASRLRHALRGTPQHRVNGSAAVLLLAAVCRGTGALEGAAAAALERLGVTGPRERDWDAARAAVTRAWDLWVLDGQRTGAIA